MKNNEKKLPTVTQLQLKHQCHEPIRVKQLLNVEVSESTLVATQEFIFNTTYGALYLYVTNRAALCSRFNDKSN